MFIFAQFQKVQFTVTWHHALGLNVMVAGVHGARDFSLLIADRKQTTT
jgi:hypothetical protein